MWDLYADLAEQRLRELYEDAAVRRSAPPAPPGRSGIRLLLGHTLVRWGERLVAPAGTPVAHG